VTRPESARAARFIGLVLVLAACAPPSASPSEAGSPNLESPAPATVCDTSTTPILNAPDGAQLVLGDGPGGTSTWVDPEGMQFFLRQIGDCVWIIGFIALEPDEPPFLTAFHGRLEPNFRITGTFSDTTGVLVPGYDNGRFVFRIEFSGNEAILVEDRAETGPPGCSGGPGSCPEPRELRRLPAPES
jgi:hypothetical protein